MQRGRRRAIIAFLLLPFALRTLSLLAAWRRSHSRLPRESFEVWNAAGFFGVVSMVGGKGGDVSKRSREEDE